jgi:hypothetical protein
MDREPIHIGNGVYLQNDYQPGTFIITTGSHKQEDADNEVYLDGYVAVSLLKELAKRLGKTIS